MVLTPMLIVQCKSKYYTTHNHPIHVCILQLSWFCTNYHDKFSIIIVRLRMFYGQINGSLIYNYHG